MDPDIKELLADYQPSQYWHHALATDAQARLLNDLGMEHVPISLRRGEASHLIDKLRNRVPATSAQRRLLKDRGAWQPDMGKVDAERLIGDILGEPKS